MAETGMKWYVLRAVSGKEAKVKEYVEAAIKHDPVLAANVGQVILPTEKYAMMRNGKRVIKERLYQKGAVYASMSGSGSSVFALSRIPIYIDDDFADCFHFHCTL